MGIKRIFVQGDRDAVGMEEAAQQLGRIVAGKQGWGFSLGAYGELVPLIASSGPDCLCHETLAMGKKSKVPTDIPNVKGAEFPSWGTRLDHFLPADAFLFFPGRAGTAAHMIPILAHIIKGEIEKGLLARKVVLLGWSDEAFEALGNYMNLCMGLPMNRAADRTWIRRYGLSEVEAAVSYLTAE